VLAVSRAATAPAVLTATWVTTAALSLAGAVLTVVVWNDLVPSDRVANLAGALSAVLYATLGTLIVRRARNVVGWLLLGVGAGLAVLTAENGYGVAGLTRPGTVPAPELVGLLAELCFIPVLGGFIATFLLFPDGRLPSPRWRPVAWLGLLAAALALAGLTVHPRMVGLPAPGGVSVRFPNPLAITSLGPFLPTVLVGTFNGLGLLVLPFVAAAIVSLVVRYWSGGRDVRQQIKWLAFMLAVEFASQLAMLLGLAAHDGAPNLVTDAGSAVSGGVALIGVPAVVTLAILKHRLYEIDVIINKTVKYGLLSAALTGVYAAIVVGIGTLAGYVGGPLLTVAAAVAIAVLFQPVRDRAQGLANRLVYGRRATPYQVLADFAEDMAGQLDAEAAAEQALAEAESARYVRDDLIFPPFAEATRAVAVRHGNELLGALTVLKPRDEQVSAAEDKLLTHLASQAGLVLRNVRLTAELRATIEDLTASRRRLVRAQDEERHRIERNLHDGAQQQLIALAVLLRLLEDAATEADEVRLLTAQLQEGLHAALDDLRALARGIYPPLLAEQGLLAALQAQARRVPLPVSIEADGIGRYQRETEATAYFCILEALQNVAKYARASRATITLACPDGQLEFSVTDDGVGFDTAATLSGTGPDGTGPQGTGLQGMADRLAAAGGNFRVRSEPGLGTTVLGRLPA
jgi:signal transduction histidine kinase